LRIINKSSKKKRMENLSVNISNGFVHHIAQALDCDMICFVNPDTFEMENVPHDFLSGMYHDETWQETLDRVDQWEQYITIGRPGPSEPVKIDQHIRWKLRNELAKKSSLPRVAVF